jgi:hypothetical protein
MGFATLNPSYNFYWRLADATSKMNIWFFDIFCGIDIVIRRVGTACARPRRHCRAPLRFCLNYAFGSTRTIEEPNILSIGYNLVWEQSYSITCQ